MPAEFMERIKMDTFIDGIQDPETRKAVLLAAKETFAETITCALTNEIVNAMVRPQDVMRRNGNVNHIGFDRAAMGPRTRDGGGKIKCWRCGNTGHISRDCWQRKEANNIGMDGPQDGRDSSDCWRCGKRGHISRDCREWVESIYAGIDQPAIRPRDGGGRIRCWICGRKGHISRDCWEVKRRRLRSPSPMRRRSKEEVVELDQHGSWVKGSEHQTKDSSEGVDSNKEEFIGVRRMRMLPAEGSPKGRIEESRPTWRWRHRYTRDQVGNQNEMGRHSGWFKNDRQECYYNRQWRNGLSREHQPEWKKPYTFVGRLNDVPDTGWPRTYQGRYTWRG